MNMNINEALNNMEKDNYVIFDLETTGLSTDEDCIVEISAIKVKEGIVAEEFSTLVNPGVHIPYAASSINGITDDMIKDAPDTEHALAMFMGYIGDNVLVGHNIISFDLKFLQRDIGAYFGETLNNPFIDTLYISREYLPELERYSLEELANFYGISYAGAHRALTDCKINDQIYRRLIKESENSSEAAKKVKICPRCGNILRKRAGRFDKFLGCLSYPDCKYTRDL